MTKKLIGFDLDDTLSTSKTRMDDRMAELLDKLLEKYHVCVMSGGKYEQFQVQVLEALRSSEDKLERLHLMPTCGTRYYKFTAGKWQQQYADDFSSEQKAEITKALNHAVDELRMRTAKPWGELIEDRGSQITFSALGQEAPVEAKEAWDPDGSKKLQLRERVAELIPDFEVRAGGTTSIDVTRQGIDKAYGIKKLMEELKLEKEEILFIGDKMQPGGNDYPVKLMGVDTMEIRNWKETALVIEAILLTS